MPRFARPNRITTGPRWKAARISFLVAVAMIALIPANSAIGTNLLGHRAGQNSTITVEGCNLESHISNAYTWTLVNNIIPTDISVSAYACSSNGREIEVYDGNYGDTGWAGRWFCSSWDIDFIACTVGTIQINTRNPGYVHSGTSVDYHRAVLCHEFGHAVGLAHTTSTSSCMRNPAVSAAKYYNSHDKIHINSLY